ncbi:synaptogenesis protein syg-2-like isoform X2 [Lineus longissimus]|uniref:synaptogenesis protein syg-2-like isoform X2 n=1 Tax=Lineus longissimus TaxID=88925 RepID=UPI00315D96DC
MDFDFLACCVFAAVIPHVHLIVPPKTPVLSGFEPAANGSYRELVCDASQPDAGTITYKWYRYSVANGVENWEPKGPIGTSQMYVFSPVTAWKYFYGVAQEPVSGKYICRATNFAGTRDSEWGDLYVYIPCSLYTVSVSPLKPAIGSTFTLNCNIPNPSGFTVKWLKRIYASSAATDEAVTNKKGCHPSNDRRYSWSSCSPPSRSSKTHTFNLQVTNAQPEDFAYWFCRDIGLSCASKPVRPVVQAPPGTPQISGFPSGPVTVGPQLNLKCLASPPGDIYDWYKDGTKVTTSLSYDFHVTKASAGVYKCVARNAVGTATSSDKTLVVYYKPYHVVVSSGKTSSYVGEKDKFTCTVSGGNPSPTVKLYFKRSGGTPVEVIQGQERVMAKEDNKAEYYCEAKVTGYPALDMTSSRKTYSVTFAHTKVFFLNNPTASVQVGQMKKFTCETDESNPIPNIKWYQYMGSSWRIITSRISSSVRNGVYGGKIRISEWSVTATKAMNGAIVRCRATYSMTGHEVSRNADSTMFVKFNPNKITMLQRPPTSIHEGKLFTIVCETDSANPVANIQFYRKRTVGTWEQLTSWITSTGRAGEYNDMIRKSTLTVTANRLDNMAVFKCEVKEGSFFPVEQTTTVNVYYPPTTTSLSSSLNSAKEGDTLTLTCKASGGNPTSYTYKWFYKSKEIPNVTSKYYTIVSIPYTQSGMYRCQAINYSPGGTADGGYYHMHIFYRAKWNPEQPKSFTVRGKVKTAVNLTLHVIASPSPTNVAWFHPNQKTAIGENFTQTKVDDTTYTLSKTSVKGSDYGSYTVNVTNAVGVSSFVFELKPSEPPQTPCCLGKVNSTAISVTLTFKTNNNGGTPQTFTIEHREPGGDWIVVAKNIADPGINRDVVQKIAGLKINLMYQFRVKAVNDDGDSGYGHILEVKTIGAPNTTLTVNREGRIVTVSWTALKRSYSKVQIKYCLREKSSMACSYHYLKDQTATTASFIVDAIASYDVYLEVFDGVDMVYRSAPHVVLIPSGINVGMIAGVVVAVVILIAVVGAVVVVLHRRNKACFSVRNKRGASAMDSGIGGGPDAVAHDPFDMNFDNSAFQGENASVDPFYENDPRQLPKRGDADTRVDEAAYDEPHHEVDPQRVQGDADTRVDEAAYDEPHHEVDPERVQEVIYDETRPIPGLDGGNPPKKFEDISVDDFKQWLLSKDVTQSTYKCLAKNGFKKANVFAMLQPEHIEKLRIKPLAQEVIVQKLVKGFQQESGSESSKRVKPAGDGDGEGGAYEEMENPYAELNITPDVIASRTYAELKP